MRETVRSLRIYLALSGTLGALVNLGQIAHGSLPGWLTLIVAVGLAANLGLLYLAIRLRPILRGELDRGLHIVHGNVTYMVTILGLVLLQQGAGLVAAQVGLGLLILWYIRRNLIRLAAGEQARTPTEQVLGSPAVP